MDAGTPSSHNTLTHRETLILVLGVLLPVFMYALGAPLGQTSMSALAAAAHPCAACAPPPGSLRHRDLDVVSSAGSCERFAFARRDR